MRRPRTRLQIVTVAALLVAGCGSADPDDLPAPADKARDLAALDDGVRVGELDGRARVLRLYDERSDEVVAVEPAGVGPAQLAAEADRFYVTDPVNDGLLVFQTQPRLRLTRRVYIDNGPRAIGVGPQDNDLYVATEDRLYRMSGNSRPAVKASVPIAPGVVDLSPSAEGVVLTRADGSTERLGLPDPDDEQQR